MSSFTFSVKGRKDFTVKAPNKVTAMGLANAHYGSLPQGAWMDTVSPLHFYWALGNFFD